MRLTGVVAPSRVATALVKYALRFQDEGREREFSLEHHTALARWDDAHIGALTDSNVRFYNLGSGSVPGCGIANRHFPVMRGRLERSSCGMALVQRQISPCAAR